MNFMEGTDKDKERIEMAGSVAAAENMLFLAFNQIHFNNIGSKMWELSGV